MAGPKPYRLDAFSGLNTRSPRTSMKVATKDDPRFDLHEATNVDITGEGKLKSRPGQELFDSANCTALWSDDEVMFAVLDGTLYEFDQTFAATAIAEVGAAPCAFCRENGVTYFATTGFTGSIVDGALQALGIPQPTVALTLSASSNGGLFAGQHGIGYSFVAADGRESGMSEPQWFELTADGGITIAGIPNAGMTVNLYATEANGTTFWRVGQVAAGVSSVLLTAVHSGLPAQNIGKWPAPTGVTDLCIYRGVMYAVVMGMVLHSDPLTYGWWDPENHLNLPSPAINLLPVTDGLFVACADRLLFLAGRSPADFEIAQEYRCIPVPMARTDIKGQNVGANGLARWALTTDRGVLFLYDGGTTTNQTQARIVLPKGISGAAVLREFGGDKHLITTLQNDSPMVLQDSMTATVFYNGLPVKEQAT